MTFWTIMILTFTIPGDGEMQSVLLYPSAQACGDAVKTEKETA